MELVGIIEKNQTNNSNSDIEMITENIKSKETTIDKLSTKDILRK